MFKLLQKFKSFYQTNLTYQQDSKNIEKLTRWAVLFVIVLDIFVYSSIGLGIEFQTRTLNNPDTKFTYQCRNIVQSPHHIKNHDWNQYRFTNTKAQRNTDYIYASGKTEGSQHVIRTIQDKELDARCWEIKSRIQTIAQTEALKNTKDSIQSLSKLLTKYTTDLEYIQNNYNTVLFEKIAEQKSGDSILEMDLDTQNAKQKYDTLQEQITTAKKQVSALKEKFASHPLVTELYEYVAKDKGAILEDYETLTKHYFLKKALIIVLFLLPIALLFYWLMKVHNTKRNYTKYIICKNIFAITMAFLILNLIPIIYNFLPHAFLERVLLFFYSLEVPFLAYYVLLALGILCLGYIILRIQNANKNKQKTTITFIESYRANKCEKCGIKVDYALMNYCPNCSNPLKMECGHCGKMTIKAFDYCAFCQEKVKKDLI